MKTIYGHPIINEKGTEYVFFKDYIKILKIIEEQQALIEDTKIFVKCLCDGDYLSKVTQKNILDRLGERNENNNL